MNRDDHWHQPAHAWLTRRAYLHRGPTPARREEFQEAF